MERELSVDRCKSLLLRRFNSVVTVSQGPLKGHSGRPFKIGRDGRLALRVPWKDRPGLVTIEVDWLNTDLGSAPLRAAFRARREIAQMPEAIIDVWSCWLPQRIVKEDLADFRERI